MRGMDEYQAAERETAGEAGMGSRAVAPKGQPAKKSRQAVSKRSHGSASKGEPIPKKARRESEAEASMPIVVPPGSSEMKKRRRSPCPSLPRSTQQGPHDLGRGGTHG